MASAKRVLNGNTTYDDWDWESALWAQTPFKRVKEAVDADLSDTKMNVDSLYANADMDWNEMIALESVTQPESHSFDFKQIREACGPAISNECIERMVRNHPVDASETLSSSPQLPDLQFLNPDGTPHNSSMSTPPPAASSDEGTPHPKKNKLSGRRGVGRRRTPPKEATETIVIVGDDNDEDI